MTNNKEFKLCNIYRMDQRQYTSQHLDVLVEIFNYENCELNQNFLLHKFTFIIFSQDCISSNNT